MVGLDGGVHDRRSLRRDRSPEATYGRFASALHVLLAVGTKDRPMARILELTLNGRHRIDAIPDNRLLLDYLRESVGLTGTKTGCDGGECGACTVLIDDRPTLSCLTLAATVAGKRVDTVESLAQRGALSAVQRGFHEKLGSQCGYCTPGFIMASAGLLRRQPNPSESEIRAALGSNICRCTGYVKIIEAVQHAAHLLQSAEAPHP
jgi:4-hydroxybenzoyl-CoA reductase subunit gamma